MVSTIGVVTNSGTIAQTKHLTSLLTYTNTIGETSGAVASSELVRISISLDSRTEFLGRPQIEILNVICIKRSRFSTRRAFSNSSETVPSNTITVAVGVHNIKNTLLYTSFIKTLARSIPGKFRHSIILP